MKLRLAIAMLAAMGVLAAGAWPAAAQEPALGPVADFSVFTLEDAKISESSLDGRTAVGGNAFFDAVNVALPLGPADRDDLVVRGLLDYQNGSVAGNIVVGGRATLVEVTSNAVRSNPTFDFAGAQEHLVFAAASWAELPPTGATTLETVASGQDVTITLRLEGRQVPLEVFEVAGADLALADVVVIDAAPGSTVLVNVSGPAIFFAAVNQRSFTIDAGAADPRRLLFNFFEARDVAIVSSQPLFFGDVIARGGSAPSSGFPGTLFAPFAAVRADNAVVKGSLIAASLTASRARFATAGAFEGTLPAPTPHPAPEPPVAIEPGAPREPAADVEALGPAAGFGLFVLGAMAADQSSAVGRVAVGGAAALTQYTVGASPLLPPDPCLQQARFALIDGAGTRDDLIAGESLFFTNGSVARGNARSGGAASLTNVTFESAASRFLEGSPIDFAAAAAYLEAASLDWASLPANGETRVERGDVLIGPGAESVTRISFVGGDPDLNVFAARAFDLSIATEVRFFVPARSTVLVNVSGEILEIESITYSLNEADCPAAIGEVADRRKVLLNLYEVRRLRVHRAEVKPSILAPLARARVDAATLHGSLIVAAFEGAFGQTGGETFAGFLPRVDGIERFAPVLGPAADFNVFVLGDFNIPGPEGAVQGVDVQGRVAAGGNAFITHFAPGDDAGAGPNGIALPQSFGARDDLIVGGVLDAFQVHFPKGNARSGGRAGFDFAGFDLGARYEPGNPIDFEAAREYLEAVSDFWAALPPTATPVRTDFPNGDAIIALSGTDETLNVFALTESDIEAAVRIDVSFPPQSTLLVNVAGEEIDIGDFAFVVNSVSGGVFSPTARQHILYNFFEARTLRFRNIAVEGTVLAPRALVDSAACAFEGQVIAAAWDGQGEPHNFPFTGALPLPVEEPPPPPPEPGARQRVHIEGGACVAGGAGAPGAALLSVFFAGAAAAAAIRLGRGSGRRR